MPKMLQQKQNVKTVKPLYHELVMKELAEKAKDPENAESLFFLRTSSRTSQHQHVLMVSRTAAVGVDNVNLSSPESSADSTRIHKTSRAYKKRAY